MWSAQATDIVRSPCADSHLVPPLPSWSHPLCNTPFCSRQNERGGRYRRLLVQLDSAFVPATRFFSLLNPHPVYCRRSARLFRDPSAIAPPYNWRSSGRRRNMNETNTETNRIREFIASSRSTRRSKKTAGLDEVLLVLHREGATYPEMVDYLKINHDVVVTRSGIGKRVRHLLKQGTAARDGFSSASRQSVEPVAPEQAAPASPVPAIPMHASTAEALEPRNAREPGATFARRTTTDAPQNSPTPAVPPGRERLGPRYDSNSPEALEREARLEESIRQQRIISPP